VYKAELRQLMSYIRGNRKAITKDIEVAMKQAAVTHDFERAAHLRNQLRALRELQQRVYFGDREFLDISKDEALSQLTTLLTLPHEPRRIEGYDISHLAGSDVVASMVVFTNGASDRAEYRKFKVKQVNDDYANMYEVVFRRLSPARLKQWGKPDLLLVDGGKGQLDAALKAAHDRDVTIPTISIAKREEEIVVRSSDFTIPESDDYTLRREGDYTIINLHPGQLNASSHSKNLRAQAGVYPYDSTVKLFQRIRDEAHRFAISYHTALRRTRSTSSQLDEIPGIGPKTRSSLLRQFGSVRAIAEADISQIAVVIGQKKAELVSSHLHPQKKA
jgi:excinuclease ABC subunit C